MHAQGLLDDGRIHADLSEIVNGKVAGRETPEELIHFAAIGLGISDVALGSLVYDRAMQAGLGRRLSLWESPIWV